MLNISKVYQKHRPAGADEAMRGAMAGAAEAASHIAAAHARTSFANLCKRQMSAAADFADRIAEIQRNPAADAMFDRMHRQAAKVAALFREA